MHDLPAKSPWEPCLDSESEPGVGTFPAMDCLGAQRGSWLDAPSKAPFPGPELPGLGGRYADLQLLGTGATSSVYRAMDTLLRRPVALKLLHIPGEGALAEAQAQAQVEHPNICRIYEVGSGFLVMQLLDGPTLADLAPGMDRSLALTLVRDVARGVHAAHLRGLLHLDLKLNNILTSRHEDGTLTPAVGDFGMTRFAGDPDPSRPCPLGTPPYTAPEQAARNLAALGPATDVYSLGVMLYILLTGRSPFEFAPQASLLETISQGQWIPMGQAKPPLPKDLVSLVERCMHRDPAQRYGSALALAEDLDRLLAHEPLEVMGRAWGYQARKHLRRNRKLVLAFGLGVLPLSLALIYGWRQGHLVVEQAAWDHHFQSLVKELQVGLERAYRRPIHDIRPELDAAHGTVQAIEKEMAKNGQAAKGPGHAALGQAALALGSGVEAVEGHFQAAWAEGYRTAEVRTWLETLDSMRKEPQSNMNGLQSGLSPASSSKGLDRLILPGKASLDQIRAAYLMRREGLNEEDGPTDEKILELTRAYRRKAPNDLQALLDEWDATLNQLRATWIKLRGSEGSRASMGDPSLESLRAHLRRLEVEGPLAGPSHPGIYLRLAAAARNPLVKPWGKTSDSAAAYREASKWYELGQRVCSLDDPLNGAFLDFLAWDALGAFSSVEGLRGEWRRLLKARPDLALLAPPALLKHVEEGELRGVPSLAFGCEALRLVGSLCGPGRNNATQRLAEVSVQMARLSLNRGQDPAPFLALATGFLGEATKGTEQTRRTRLKAALVEKEREWMLGRRPKSGLEEINHLAEGLVLGLDDSLDLATYRCRASDTPEAWESLARMLKRFDVPRSRFMEEFGLPFLASARLLLLEHRASQGNPILKPLADFKERLRWLLEGRKGQDNRLIHGLLAQAALLEARCSPSPKAVCLAGLREVTEALAPAPHFLPPIKTDHWWCYGAGPGQFHKLKGQLWLALAGMEGPQFQGPLAEKALVSFQMAQRQAPFLETSLEPLMAQARRRSTFRTRFRPPTLNAPFSEVN